MSEDTKDYTVDRIQNQLRAAENQLSELETQVREKKAAIVAYRVAIQEVEQERKRLQSKASQ